MYSQSMYGTDPQPQQPACSEQRPSVVRPHATHTYADYCLPAILNTSAAWMLKCDAKYERRDQIIILFTWVSVCCRRYRGKTAVRVSAGCGQAMCECMRPIHSYTHRLIIIIVMNSERNAYDDKHVIIHGTETETIIGTAAAT